MTKIGNRSHPISTLVDQAAENIRLANHACYGDTREVIELYDTFGSLTQLLKRLPQLLDHLQLIVRDAGTDSYVNASDDSPTDYLLQMAEACLAEAATEVTEVADLINSTWSHIGRLRPRDIDDPE
jgi:hypothetical protein